MIGPSSFAALDPSPMEKLLKAGFVVVNNPFGRKLTKGEVVKLLPGVEGLIAGLETLDEEVMCKSELKVISRCGSGISNVDIKTAEKLGIKVYCTPYGPTRAVAELTLGCLLTLIRQVPQMSQALHQRRWDKRIGRQLKGMRVLIIGYGRIGKAVGDLLKAFEVEVLICDPAYPENDEHPRSMNLHSALPQADVITLHCDGEDQLLGPHEFTLMKPGVFLLNAARGDLIDEAALRQALDSGQVVGAWLDTFGREPYDGPLIQYEQVILTPHIGSYTYEGRLQMEIDAVKNLLQGFEDIEKG